MRTPVQPRKKWELSDPDKEATARVAKHLDVCDAVARALVNRDITGADSADTYFSASLDSLHDPFLMYDMEPAVDRICHALDNNERILILGDYDVDGISGAAVMVSFLRSLGARVNYYIPDRASEGYGLSEEVVRKSHKAEYSLIITVDSGVSAVNEAALATELGLDLIITDHHEPPEKLPQATALLNPKREEDKYPFRDLAGVGVAFKLVCAIGIRRGVPIQDIAANNIELAALGTVADMVPLMGENRIVARRGLAAMAETDNLGLRHLIDLSRYNRDDPPDTHLISFGLAPRINAAGRVWNPRAGVELLLADTEERAQKIARRLDHQNQARIQEEGLMFDQAVDILERSGLDRGDKSIVLFHEDWNVGIVGIVASKLLERHYRPVILLTLSGRPDDVKNPHPERGRVCQGSARSIREVDIHATLCKCEDLLISFGGHPMAAGLKIYERDLPHLRDRLNELIGDLPEQGRYEPVLSIDSEIRLEHADTGLLDQVLKMEPCGVGNPRPVFCARGVTVLETRPCGAEGNHLLMRLGQGHAVCGAIGFRFLDHWAERSLYGNSLDVAFTLKEDNFRNQRNVKLNLIDLRPATQDTAPA